MKENIIFRRGNNHAWISIVWCRNGYPLQPKNGAGDKIGLATDIGYLSILYTHWYAIYITNIISTCICYVIFFVLDMICVHTYLHTYIYIYIYNYLIRHSMLHSQCTQRFRWTTLPSFATFRKAFSCLGCMQRYADFKDHEFKHAEQLLQRFDRWETWINDKMSMKWWILFTMNDLDY